MTMGEFDAILERRIGLMRSVLASKGEEYATDQDQLHNFKRAAQLRREPDAGAPEVLLGMLVKHWVSIEDLVHNWSFVGAAVARIDEKIGDAINYLVLLEALLKEGRSGQ